MNQPSISRRSALAAGAAAGAGFTIGSTTAAAVAAPAMQSRFGCWESDAAGLPVYRFAADLPVTTHIPAGRDYPLEPDPVFLLGNYDLTMFCYASGLLKFISGERGWVRMNEPTAKSPGNRAMLKVTGGGESRTHDLLGLDGTCAKSATAQRRFGCGTARFSLRPDPRVSVERVVSVRPSTATERAQPAAVVSVRVTNMSNAPLDLEYTEAVLSNPTIVLNRAPVGGERPLTFVNDADTLPGKRGIMSRTRATSNDPMLVTEIDAPNRYNTHPPALVLMAPQSRADGIAFAQRAADAGAIELSARTSFKLAPGASRDIVLVVALKSQEAELAPLLAFVDALPASRTGDYFRAEWGQVLASLSKVPDPALRDELVWDGHALLAMATHANYYGYTFIPQGMTYDYYIDLTAAPRDHLQHALAAAYFAPGLAKSTINYTLCKMTYQGEIKYTDFGNGDTSNSMWNTSDQQLFLFYSLGEYLRITRDWSILEDKTPFLPKEANFQGTTLHKLERAFAYLRDEVATGPHGLVRLMNSDWSDMVYVDTPVSRYWGTAESQMNSAMVMAVMPNMIAQLKTYGARKGGDTAATVGRLTKAMQMYVDRITAAMMRDMEGRTYARRVWLDPKTALGDDDMHLEPQSFLLQAPEFPVERKRVLLGEMQRRLIAGEVLGPRQREKPLVGGTMLPGTSENGGYWYALGAQAIAGVATFDRKAALALLDKMTFRNFARHYPTYWVGQWTAPDVINAEISGAIAGLPRPDNDWLWTKMANYCAHPHAWPIYCYFRIRDEA